MTYPPTGPGYPNTAPPASSGAQGIPGPGHPPFPPPVSTAGRPLVHLLGIPVFALGVVNFLLGFAPFVRMSSFTDSAVTQSSFEGGYPVIGLALLLTGGLLAGLSLLPGQAHQATAAVTSLVGFLVPLFFLFTLSDGVSLAWGGVLVVVLAFVQAAVACTVLLFTLGVLATVPRPTGLAPQYGAPGYAPAPYPPGYGAPAPAPGQGYPVGYGPPPGPGYAPAPNPYGQVNPYATTQQYPAAQPYVTPTPPPAAESGGEPAAPTQAFDAGNPPRPTD